MATTVQHNLARSRYEILVDDRIIGFADYHVVDDTVVFPHTEIEWSMRGRGLGAELVRHALDDVRRTGGKVVAECWFVSEFIAEHPEYGNLVAR
jgi:predicted GNAT family acetyltransferase